MATAKIQINRAPVLVLWGAVVAERLGHDRATALTLGKALAGLNAQTKGRRLGIFKPPQLKPGEKPMKTRLGKDIWIELCGRSIPVKKSKNGIRAVVKDAAIDPADVEHYLDQKFGEHLKVVHRTMERLAKSFRPKELADVAYGLYEKFRPVVEAGKGGWGQKGELDLEQMLSLITRQ